jgi:pimeloyl-ACP methyl ester carboxylesterase
VKRNLWRGFKLTFLALALAALAASLVFRNWVGAQARAVTVLATTSETPVLTWFVKVVTPDPRVTETSIAGRPSTLARPEGSGPWPAVVFVNGATRRGRFHPDVQRLARGLARAGYLAVVPDLPGLPYGEISLDTLDATIRAASAVAARPDVRDHRIALLGVSVGATLALLAAESPALAGHVRLVAGIAPYTSLRKVVRLATTGTYAGPGGVIRYDADPYVRLAIARSLVAGLPAGRDRRLLGRVLREVDDKDSHPLAVLRSRAPALRSPAAAAVTRVLLNRDPARFERLYARVPASLRTIVEALSPLARAGRLRSRVELATAPEDKYFPPNESRALARASGADVSVTVTRTLTHAIPEPSFGSIADLFRFDGFVVRVLEKARS